MCTANLVINPDSSNPSLQKYAIIENFVNYGFLNLGKFDMCTSRHFVMTCPSYLKQVPLHYARELVRILKDWKLSDYNFFSTNNIETGDK